ncbi:1-phosphofructokinase family hexose kinase [Lacisediminihabitans profunda]|uniref:1-phosphofructokinase family hexose kinase n=1 Tax=Lacisediminihabitans profunda TaxID=2594790 RepID=UPI00165057E5|nr:PfkB family carbohydrate kinase [Lacisediminihabitans profunda]
MITLLALGPSVDVTYLVDEFFEGGTFRPTGVYRAAGGKAVNAARAAVTMGADVAVVAPLGGASGQFALDDAVAAGIPLMPVWATADTRTCISISSAASGLLTELYEQPSAITGDELARLHEVTDTLLVERPGWFAISGGVPASVPVGGLAALIDLAHSRGIRVAVDSHGPALAAALSTRPELLKINRAEAAEALGIEPQADLFDSAFGMAERLRGITGGTVVITDGVAGSYAVDERGRHRAEWSGDFGRYPVGSGDSYLGGLLASLDAGGTLADALRLAAGCATANALVPGAGRFAKVDALAIADEVVVS